MHSNNINDPNNNLNEPLLNSNNDSSLNTYDDSNTADNLYIRQLISTYHPPELKIAPRKIRKVSSAGDEKINSANNNNAPNSFPILSFKIESPVNIIRAPIEIPNLINELISPVQHPNFNAHANNRYTGFIGHAYSGIPKTEIMQDDEADLLITDPTPNLTIDHVIDADRHLISELAPEEPGNLSISTFNKVINSKFFLFNISTLAFLGMLSHDLIMFQQFPEERYGTTIQDVLLGLPLSRMHEFGYAKSNINTVLNHLGSDKVTNTDAYWSPVVALIALPVMETIVKTIVKFYLGSRQPARVGEEKTPLTKKMLKGALITFNYLLVTYAYVRFVSLLAQKIKETQIYNKNKSACEDEGKIYTFNHQVADFVCSICGDWDDLQIHFNQVNNPQQCFNALVTKVSDESLDRLDRLKQFTDFHNIDLSNANVNDLEDQLFANFMQKISDLHLKIDNFDLSVGASTNTALSASKVTAVIKFLQANHLNTFQIINQIILKDNLNLLIQGFNDADIDSLILNSLGLSDELVENLSITAASIANLQNLNLANNGIGDTAGSSLVRRMPTTVNAINLDNNQLSYRTAAAFNNTQFRSISLAGMQNGQTRNLNDLGKIISAPNTNYLNIRSNGLINNQWSQLAPYFNSSNAQYIDVANNAMNTKVAVNSFFAGLSKNISSLEVSGNNLPSDSGSVLQNYLTGSAITILNFSNNYLSVDSFEKFLKGVFASSTKLLDISNCGLSDSHIDILNDFLLQNPDKLKFIKLAGNQIIDDSGAKLINAMSAARVKCFDLSNNQLAEKSTDVLANVLLKSNFKEINISNNVYSSDAIVKVLTVKNSPLEQFAANGVLLNKYQLNLIAENLVISPYAVSYLNKENLNRDQSRALHAANVNSNLSFVALDSSEDSYEISNFLNRMSVVDNFPQFNIGSSNNPASRNLLSYGNEYSENTSSEAYLLKVGEFGSAVMMLFLLYQFFMKRWQQGRHESASQGYRHNSIYSQQQAGEIDLEANNSKIIPSKKLK